MVSLPRCFETSLKQYYGQQCDLFRYGPGFYGALFGSLAGALLLVIMIVIAVIAKKRYMGVWWVLFIRKIMVNNFYVLLPVIVKLQTLSCEAIETVYILGKQQTHITEDCLRLMKNSLISLKQVCPGLFILVINWMFFVVFFFFFLKKDFNICSFNIFKFFSPGDHNFGAAGTYTSQGSRQHL